MYRKIEAKNTSIRKNCSEVGETIEQKVRRMVKMGEPINDSSPLVYTERKDGVKPEHDIRTDRFEIAVEAMDKVTADGLAKRENRLKAVKKDDSVDGTSSEKLE